MIAQRQDLHFFMITKRIHRFDQCIPPDWGKGYPNVTICCTIENQDQADFRLPFYRAAPICHKQLVCSPLLGPIDLSPYLGDWVDRLTVGANLEAKRGYAVMNGYWTCAVNACCAEYPFVLCRLGRVLSGTVEFTGFP